MLSDAQFSSEFIELNENQAHEKLHNDIQKRNDRVHFGSIYLPGINCWFHNVKSVCML